MNKVSSRIHSGFLLRQPLSFIWRDVVIMKRKLALITIATVFTAALGMNVFAADSLTIATDTVFKPFEYTDEEGQFVGIDVDILAAIAQDQGFEYELKSVGWDPAIEACKAGDHFRQAFVHIRIFVSNKQKMHQVMYGFVAQSRYKHLRHILINRRNLGRGGIAEFVKETIAP